MKVSDVVVDGDVEMPDKTSPVETEAVDETENEGGESFGEHPTTKSTKSVNKGTDDLSAQKIKRNVIPFWILLVSENLLIIEIEKNVGV